MVGAGTGNMVVSNIFDKMSSIFLEDNPQSTDFLKILGRTRAGRTYRWVKRAYIQENPYTDKYKVLIPEANGTGAIGEILSTPLIGEPLIGVTDTFICCGPFATESEAEAALKYVKSKFARTMLGVKKVTQHNPKSTWELVPLQDFTPASDIDWSRSVADIDRQLYAKYGLDEKEIEFIETHVKEMA